MRATVRPAVLPFQRHGRLSPFERLAQELGYARPKTARDNVAVAYRRVAITNRVLLEAGLAEKVGELMAVVDASLMGEPEPLKDAIDSHNLCDAREDEAQAEFLKNAGDRELDAWKRKLANDLFHGEKLLQSIIAEQHRRKADAEGV